MIPRDMLSLRAVALCFLLPIVSHGQELSVMPDNGRGVYQPGQTIRWSVQVKGLAAAEAAYIVKKGGQTEVAQGKAPFTDGQGQIEAKLDEPGWLLVEVSVNAGDNKQIKGLGGALVSPEKIQPTAPRPADFDAFWQRKLDELAAIPVHAQVVPADGDKPGVDYFKVTMDNIRGSHIRGQLARPKEGGRLPAMLIVQWAGVYPLQK